jgi:hypothetical protein
VAAGDNDDRDGPGSQKITIGRQWRRSGLAGGRGRMRQTMEGSVANGPKGEGEEEAREASCIDGASRLEEWENRWILADNDDVLPPPDLTSPGGRVVEEEYSNGARWGAPQDLWTDWRTTMSRLHQSHIWSMEARDRARRSTKRMPATVKPRPPTPTPV